MEIQLHKDHIMAIQAIVGMDIEVIHIDPQFIANTAPADYKLNLERLNYYYAVDSVPYRVFRFGWYGTVLKAPREQGVYVNGFKRKFHISCEKQAWNVDLDLICRQAFEDHRRDRLQEIKTRLRWYWTATMGGENAR